MRTSFHQDNLTEKSSCLKSFFELHVSHDMGLDRQQMKVLFIVKHLQMYMYMYTHMLFFDSFFSVLFTYTKGPEILTAHAGHFIKLQLTFLSVFLHAQIENKLCM